MYESPLQTMVADGEVILRNLSDASRNLEMAIEQKFVAARRLSEIEQTYKDMESEFLTELIFDETAMKGAKNAEQRAIVQDASLVKARTAGKLAPAWNMLNRARSEAQAAQMAYEQMEVRFRGTRLASELRAAILLTFAKG